VTDVLPRWDVSDLHESLTARSFVDDVERLTADIARLEAAFEEHGVRACAPRAVAAADGIAADRVIAGWNDASARHQILNACAYAATVRDEPAGVAQARRMAHIHALAHGRLRGQTVAPWIHQADLTSTTATAPAGAR